MSCDFFPNKVRPSLEAESSALSYVRGASGDQAVGSERSGYIGEDPPTPTFFGMRFFFEKFLCNNRHFQNEVVLRIFVLLKKRHGISQTV